MPDHLKEGAVPNNLLRSAILVGLIWIFTLSGSSFPQVYRRYFVGAVRRYAPAFSTTTYSHSTLRTHSIGRPFQNLLDARTRLPRTPVRASVDAHLCICWTLVPISVRRGIGWKLNYDEYRTGMSISRVRVRVRVRGMGKPMYELPIEDQLSIVYFQ